MSLEKKRIESKQGAGGAEGAVRSAWCVARWDREQVRGGRGGRYAEDAALRLRRFLEREDGGCCMGRMGRMGRMVMGQGDNGTILWGTMGLWDGTPVLWSHPALRTTHYALRIRRRSVAAHTCAIRPAPRTPHFTGMPIR
jgi:hypothetical protein